MSVDRVWFWGIELSFYCCRSCIILTNWIILLVLSTVCHFDESKSVPIVVSCVKAIGKVGGGGYFRTGNRFLGAIYMTPVFAPLLPACSLVAVTQWQSFRVLADRRAQTQHYASRNRGVNNTYGSSTPLCGNFINFSWCLGNVDFLAHYTIEGLLGDVPMGKWGLDSLSANDGRFRFALLNIRFVRS